MKIIRYERLQYIFSYLYDIAHEALLMMSAYGQDIRTRMKMTRKNVSQCMEVAHEARLIYFLFYIRIFYDLLPFPRISDNILIRGTYECVMSAYFASLVSCFGLLHTSTFQIQAPVVFDTNISLPVGHYLRVHPANLLSICVGCSSCTCKHPLHSVLNNFSQCPLSESFDSIVSSVLEDVLC